MPRALPPLGRLALRFAVVGIALLGIGATFSNTIIEPLVPTLGRAVGALTSDFTFVEAFLDLESARPRVVFRANLSHVEMVGGRFVYPMGFGPTPVGWYQVTLTTGGILQHALFLFIIVLAWPGLARAAS